MSECSNPATRPGSITESTRTESPAWWKARAMRRAPSDLLDP